MTAARLKNYGLVGGIIVLSTFMLACQNSGTSATRPPLVPLRARPVELGNLKALAPKSIVDSDAPMCPGPGKPDPKEQSIGGLSSRAVYQFSSPISGC